MPRPAQDMVQVTFRLPRPMALDADRVADLISVPGKRASRTDALRAAIARGIAAIQDDASKTSDEPEPSKKTTRK